MKVLGIEIENENWDLTIKSVDNKLSKFKDFTSPTYQLKGIKSINDKWILLKPKQAHFCEVLDFDWQEYEIKKEVEVI